MTLCGFKKPEEVRKYMEKADIYLMTSDRKEGWGAVVNEAMNSGCAVVGDHMVGAVPFLLQHGKNGLIYKDGEKQQLFELTELLVRDRAYCHRLGREAIKTITGEWNAEIAAERMCGLCSRLGFLTREDMPGVSDLLWEEMKTLPVNGPCSPAPVIPERRMYGQLGMSD